MCGHWCPTGDVIEHNEISSTCVTNVDACFPAHQQSSRVVPHTVSVDRTVDETVECSVSHHADIDRRGTERSVLPPTGIGRRWTGYGDYCVVPRRRSWCRQLFAVAPGSAAPNAPPSHGKRQVSNQRHERTFGVDCAQRRCVVRNAPTRIGGTVERIDDDHDVPLQILGSRFFREHTDRQLAQHGQRRFISQQIGTVLTVALARKTPILHRRHGRGHGVGDGVEGVEQPIGSHGAQGSVDVVAVIDVAGFVSDMKSHAIDHGFHVHDERHFVETYSLRQLWEVDLHPEEACDGPIDLHLSLEVDPRALLGFEDAVASLDPEGDESPPSGFAFPLLFTWTLPPLRQPPDLLVLATELAGIGGIELPLEVSAIDSTASVTDAPERKLSIVARLEVSLVDVYENDDQQFCATLDRCRDVSLYLLDVAPAWLGDE